MNDTITLTESLPAFGPDGKGKTAEPGKYTLQNVDGDEQRGVAYLTDEGGEWYCVQRSGLRLNECRHGQQEG